MSIQRRLLLEQIELLNNCELGNKVMRGAKPRSVEEFRELVPITTYADYAPYLPEKIESALPAKPILWQRTAGRSEFYTFKWIPTPKKMYEELGEIFLAVLIFASCEGRGDIVLEEHDKLLYAMAPPPYVSGSWARRAGEEGIFDFLPPLDKAEKMEFEERMVEGFRMAMSEGMDMLFAIAGVLVVMGEQLGQAIGLRQVLSMWNRPQMFLRMLKAIGKSKLARRSLLPRDIWSLKLLVAGGTDSTVYREKIKNTWGRYPLDVYGSTEGVMTAMQTWDYESMTFVPQINFLEFMPRKEYRKWAMDPTYKPDVFLLDEVIPGETYGLVITNFYGGALVRYFLGDMVKITSLRNYKLNIDIPQMLFHSRVDGIIDIEGCMHMTEGAIWQGLEDSGLPYQEWVVRQEDAEKPKIHFYIEPKNGAEIDVDTAIITLSKQLRSIDPFYSVLEDMRGVTLELTLLPCGAFQLYIAKQRRAGADLAHLKPPHMNPSDEIVDFLLHPKPVSSVREESSDLVSA
jgi:hypothetical protein